LNHSNAKVMAPQGLSQETLFHRLVDGVTDYAIFLLDANGYIVSWNEGARRLKGYEPDEILGRHFSTFYPEEALKVRWPEHELEVAGQVGRFEDEGWRIRKDGSRFWANVVITAIRDSTGRVAGFSKITRDLTERRAQEERLRTSEERFRLLIENVQDYAIFLLDTRGHVASWNAGARRFKGYARDEIIGQHFSVFYPAEAIARDWPARELEEAAAVGRFEDEGWRLRKGGTRFWANVVITALRNDKGELVGFSKITRDLTERRQNEERLRQSEERFRLLLEGVEDYAIFMLDREGLVTSWNAGAQRITGYAADEVLGRSFERFFPPEEVAAGAPAQELRRASLNRRAEDRAWRVRKDGTRFWADITVTALHDEQGVMRGYAKVVRDLSERKRMELLEEQGRHLTEFLAMLAHELRNPLAPIRNALGIMALTSDLPPQINWSREVIERQTGQLTRLVDDLLDVSRITRGKLRLQGAPVDLRSAIDRAVESSRPLIDARRHRLSLDLPAQPLIVHGDMTRIVQVVLNVLNNAAKYTPEGGRIDLSAGIEGADAVIRVKDNGVGIPEHLIANIFDLFAQGERTLDRAEGGLGIGLTLARRIVALHGGSIDANSEGAGKGSEFIVRLPRLELEATDGRAEALAADLPPRMRPRSILVVDDNADSASSMAMLLRMAGHDVTVEHDGQGALRSVAQRTPDILLLDLALPGMTGYEVARHLRSRPEGQGVRIFALSGYAQEQDRQRSLAAGFDGHLVKPVMPSDLFAVLESASGKH
jgi:PAS domain S-box-containing protein